MEKISISSTDFEEFVDKFYEAFEECPYPDCKESSGFALKTLIFDVKDFNEDGWNDCDVEVPSKYIGRDLLIRLKTTVKENNGCTMRCSDYKVGYYSTLSNKFIGSDGFSIVKPDELYKYEYKLIK